MGRLLCTVFKIYLTKILHAQAFELSAFKVLRDIPHPWRGNAAHVPRVDFRQALHGSSRSRRHLNWPQIHVSARCEAILLQKVDISMVEAE